MNLMNKSISILTESENCNTPVARKVHAMLEDVNSPVTNKYIDKLFDSVIYKNHIDFGDIPNSKGNIEKYTGYPNIIEILNALTKLSADNKSDVLKYIDVVKTSINHMKTLSSAYEKGFKLRNEYVILEYNTWVYTIIQAVSALLYEYVDYIKRPDTDTFNIVILKNTKYKANTFYFQQLNNFNQINKSMQYNKYLNTIVDKSKNNFIGSATLIGIGAVVSVAIASVPIVRELVYQYYNVKSNLSDCLAQQAYFLEMNRSVVESNSSFDKKRKTAILAKQEKIKNMCLRLSEKLRVNHIKAVDSGSKKISTDNQLLTLDKVKNEVNNSSLELF